MTERWASVEGGPYEVSDLGRVRRGSRILRQNGSGRGYPAVAFSIDGKVRTRYVHHLVAAAFLGPRPEGADICHGNGDFTDNRTANLRYDTRNANMRDSLEHATHRSAGRTHCAQGHELTDANTREVVTTSSDGGIKSRRRCKTCDAQATARYLARKRAA